MKATIGVIGAGSFPSFSVQAFLQNNGVSVAGVFDINNRRSDLFSQRFNCKVFNSVKDIIQSNEVDLIYIATPPVLHYEQSKMALLAGKHVICEKPAALNPGHVEELLDISLKQGLLYVVNLMQRYNPLYQKVKQLINHNLLGGFLHGYFENYASGETLLPDHWMWDENISGGIFIEHAVHFFDMFEGWLGKGSVIASQKIQRNITGREVFSRVQSVCAYEGGLVNMYHGFDQASRMDRQELRLLFEKGDITLYEWVPVHLMINALVDLETENQLKELFSGCSVQITDLYSGPDRHTWGSFREFMADKKISLSYGKGSLKENIYQHILKEMFADQLRWITDRSHKRIITGENGLNSVRMASSADLIAEVLTESPEQ